MAQLANSLDESSEGSIVVKAEEEIKLDSQKAVIIQAGSLYTQTSESDTKRVVGGSLVDKVDGSYTLEAEGKVRLVFDEEDMQLPELSSGAGSEMLIDPATKKVFFASSTERDKEDFSSFDTEKTRSLLSLPVYNYIRKGSTKREIGIKAEELVQKFPELASLDNDGCVVGYQLQSFCSLLLALIQSQEQQIRQLQTWLRVLNGEIESLTDTSELTQGNTQFTPAFSSEPSSKNTTLEQIRELLRTAMSRLLVDGKSEKSISKSASYFFAYSCLSKIYLKLEEL